MFLRRLARMARSPAWGHALLELVIVALGIFMAVQVDRWREGRNDLRREREYIARLADDVQQDTANLNASIRLAELRRSFVVLLMDVAEAPSKAQKAPVDFVLAVTQAGYTNTPALTSNTFDELRSTGTLGLLRDPDLKKALAEYYGYDTSERQYLSLQIGQELRHFELGAGILSNRLARRVVETWRIAWPGNIAELRRAEVDPEEVRRAAARLQRNAAFVAWLPLSLETQVELVESHTQRLERAEKLLAMLRAGRIE
jgi:hypothetical protein